MEVKRSFFLFNQASIDNVTDMDDESFGREGKFQHAIRMQFITHFLMEGGESKEKLGGCLRNLRDK